MPMLSYLVDGSEGGSSLPIEIMQHSFPHELIDRVAWKLEINPLTSSRQSTLVDHSIILIGY
jgi:hypothetical protein